MTYATRQSTTSRRNSDPSGHDNGPVDETKRRVRQQIGRLTTQRGAPSGRAAAAVHLGTAV